METTHSRSFILKFRPNAFSLMARLSLTPSGNSASLTFMIDADVVACSPASVYRVLKAAGLLAGCSRNVTKEGTGFQQPVRPHEHWHVDVRLLGELAG